jgi:hypothetical protein
MVQQRRGVREVGDPVGIVFAERGDAHLDMFVELAFPEGGRYAPQRSRGELT